MDKKATIKISELEWDAILSAINYYIEALKENGELESEEAEILENLPTPKF